MAQGMRLTFTTKGIMESTGLSRRKVQMARDYFNQTVQSELEKLILENFDKLSTGGRGVNRRKWKPLEPSTIKRKGHNLIGVDKGDLRASLKLTTNNRGTVAAFGTDHAEYFDAVRPLLPDEFPATWARKIEKAATKAIIRVLGQ